MMPSSNEKDLRDIPDEVRNSMKFTFAADMDDVLRVALLPQPEPPLVDAATEPDAPTQLADFAPTAAEAEARA
jgi:hypothetical protein